METVIQSIFVNEIQTKRVTKELNFLAQHYSPKIVRSQHGLKIIVEFEPLKIGLKHITKNIVLHIVLDSKFPFAFPRLYFKSPLLNPQFSDGRDFIEDVLQKPWTPSVLVHQIVSLVPAFLQRVEENRNDRQLLLSYGRFHIDAEYGIEDLEQLDGMFVFTCRDKKQQQYMLINNNFILFFDVVNDKSTLLLNFEPVTQLLSVAKKQNSSNEMLLTWSDENNHEGRHQTLMVNESDICLNTLISIKQSGGALIKRHFTIPEEEVTLRQYSSTNISDIIMNIQIMESDLSQNITVNLVNSIMNHYQKAIEFYSAHNDPAFENFIDRLHQLLSREDVQLVLQSVDQKKEEDLQPQKKEVEPEVPSQVPHPEDQIKNFDIL